MKTRTIITRSHILIGARRGGYIAGLKRHNKQRAHSSSPTCSLRMSDVCVCEKCGESMSLRDLIVHSRSCANNTHWFEMLPVMPISEERKLKHLFGYAK